MYLQAFGTITTTTTRINCQIKLETGGKRFISGDYSVYSFLFRSAALQISDPQVVFRSIPTHDLQQWDQFQYFTFCGANFHPCFPTVHTPEDTSLSLLYIPSLHGKLTSMFGAEGMNQSVNSSSCLNWRSTHKF